MAADNSNIDNNITQPVDEKEDEKQEVFVNGTDGRKPVYDTNNKNYKITQCIGQLKTYFPGVNGYTSGTGTVFHVQGTKCFVITCAHNVRKTKRNENKETKILKANRVEFIRRKTDKSSFGEQDKTYWCETKPVLIYDKQYEKYPHIKSGNDFAILVIDDKKAAEYYSERCKNIYIVNGWGLFHHINKFQMHLFGYPGDKRLGHQFKMWGMSTAPKNILKVARDQNTNKLYLINPEMDAWEGQSGAAIYHCSDDDGPFYILGVHTGGSKVEKQNYGTVIDFAKIEAIRQCIGDSVNNKVIHDRNHLICLLNEKYNNIKQVQRMTNEDLLNEMYEMRKDELKELDIAYGKNAAKQTMIEIFSEHFIERSNT
eukprot:100777_1